MQLEFAESCVELEVGEFDTEVEHFGYKWFDFAVITLVREEPREFQKLKTYLVKTNCIGRI